MMTVDEVEKISDRIYNGLDMLTEKAEKIGRAKSEWSLCDLGMMADIEKDIAKSFKYLVHTYQMLSEKSIEKY